MASGLWRVVSGPLEGGIRLLEGRMIRLWRVVSAHWRVICGYSRGGIRLQEGDMRATGEWCQATGGGIRPLYKYYSQSPAAPIEIVFQLQDFHKNGKF